MINEICCGSASAWVAYVTYGRSRDSREAGERTEARKWMIVSIIAGVFAVLNLFVVVVDTVISEQPSLSPAQPRRSRSATPLPTVIPIPGWEKFEGGGVELWLPESYEGGDPSEDLDAIIEILRTLGPDHEQTAQKLEQNPSMFLLWMVDWEVGDSGFLTRVIVGTMRVPSDVTLDAILDEFLAEPDSQVPVIEREIVPLDYYQAGRVVMEDLRSGVTLITYAIKDVNTVWLVSYSTGTDEFDQRLPTFEQSIRTFRVQPPKEEPTVTSLPPTEPLLQEADAYNNRGVDYLTKGDYDRALADFDQAIALDPLYADAYYNRGIAYYNKGDVNRATSDLERALELGLDPSLRQQTEALLEELR